MNEEKCCCTKSGHWPFAAALLPESLSRLCVSDTCEEGDGLPHGCNASASGGNARTPRCDLRLLRKNSASEWQGGGRGNRNPATWRCRSQDESHFPPVVTAMTIATTITMSPATTITSPLPGGLELG
jgi:hypothetical protein